MAGKELSPSRKAHEYSRRSVAHLVLGQPIPYAASTSETASKTSLCKAGTQQAAKVASMNTEIGNDYSYTCLIKHCNAPDQQSIIRHLQLHTSNSISRSLIAKLYLLELPTSARHSLARGASP
jgi:hypothetical protein